MSEQQAPYNTGNELPLNHPELTIPSLRFVECEDNHTQIFVNAAKVGVMQEESDNIFYIELYFLGSFMGSTFEGTMETAQQWVKGKWREFYHAIHTTEYSQ